MMRAHDDAARLAQRDADIAATTAMDEAEYMQGDEPTWARFGYAIAVTALWGVSAGLALGAIQYVFAR